MRESWQIFQAMQVCVQRNVSFLSPFCFYFYFFGTNLFCQYFPQELYIAHSRERKLKQCSRVAFDFKPVLSSFLIFECAEKVCLAGFSVYNSVPSSLGPNDVCLLVL